MKINSKVSLLEKGVRILFKGLGPAKTIEFFQEMGINKGDSLKEIEIITEKLSKKEVLYGIRKARKS